jgi:ABC-2 type transport system ATP-binding protein
MLRLHALQKRYGSRLVLDIAELGLEPGLYWLRGSNGSGKTTLLRILAGILPFDGDVYLQGPKQSTPISLRKSPTTYRRLIAWADAEPQYPGFLTGLELLDFYRNILHPEPAQVRQLIECFGAGPWLSTRTASWSSGMTKQLSLILALLGSPVLTLFDEPFTTLDEPGRIALTACITDVRTALGASFLVSSHQDITDSRVLPGTRALTLYEKSIILKGCVL